MKREANYRDFAACKILAFEAGIMREERTIALAKEKIKNLKKRKKKILSYFNELPTDVGNVFEWKDKGIK